MSDTTEYLSAEEVCTALDAHGADTASVSRVFAARLEPENLDDPDRKFVIACPVPGGRAMLVVYRFGLGKLRFKESPLDEDTGPDWRPRFLSVEGPYRIELDENRKPRDDCEAVLKAKELTA